jgi:hypothetical protein
VTPRSSANVELVRRGFDDDPNAFHESVVWHFQSPVPDLVRHFSGRDELLRDLPRMLDEVTSGTFSKRLTDVWAVGDDLVVAHVEVTMTIGGEDHNGSSVVVYRIAGGVVVEGFDIPSASI